MASISSSVQINAPAERVYEMMTDLESAPQRISGIQTMEVLTDGPFGVGTRFRETRIMFGKEAVETMEVSAVEPGRSYTTEAESHGSHYTCVVAVEPAGEGCTLSMSMDAKPLSLVSKVMCAL